MYALNIQFLWRQRIKEPHRDNFVRGLSVYPSVCLSFFVFAGAIHYMFGVTLAHVYHAIEKKQQIKRIGCKQHGEHPLFAYYNFNMVYIKPLISITFPTNITKPNFYRNVYDVIDLIPDVGVRQAPSKRHCDPVIISHILKIQRNWELL